MRRIYLILIVCVAEINVSAQQTFTVTNSGSVFTPSLVNAKVGDKITFSVGSFHPVLQVSEATYLANGTAALSGGFSFPSGSGTYTANEAGTVYYVCKNHILSGMKGKIEVTDPTAVPKQENSSGFGIYPNPATDFITIKNSEASVPISVDVYDISGKKLMNSFNENISRDLKTVNVNNLRKGIYFISVSYPDKTFTRKFIKL